MNTNLFQTILTVIITASGLISSLLVSLGCKASPITGALDCTAANAPIWLIPYLVGAATVLGIAKLLLAAFEGKLAKPTVAVPKGKEAFMVPKSPSQ